MHKFGVPQGGVLFGRGFPPPGRGGYPPQGGVGGYPPGGGAPPPSGGVPPPSPPPGGGGGGPPRPLKKGFSDPPPGVDFWVKIGPRGFQPRVNTDGRTIKIRKVSIWGVHLGENLSIFGAHSFRKRGLSETSFWEPRFDPPLFGFHSKNHIFRCGGSQILVPITFHQVHKSGYSEVP